ncbi:response regulator [Legionella quateirensis]|uniref:Two component sensor and regulator histidine kinase response regulator n=1 Tax=Legionella quateirensis TaxID=45072 RepID=A0A378KWX7_9GAMM|nr:response regulator [Legionella quateirensis]KTD52950.1 two component sensor and regulator histidine kinase response regulator [Legionella quateirensis]STY16320.1 two component sensor and regulator, histidine kinase response regulator [Legionella quateirensis]
MRVLIVEDSAFNAFCLRRLLESVVAQVSVTIVNNSQTALSLINSHSPDMVVIDGDLGADSDDHCCNGPELVDILIPKYPNLPLIAWSDSEVMREAFSQVFKRHNHSLNEYNSWSKVISIDRICKTWAYYFDEFMGGQAEAFSCQSCVVSC